LNKIVDVLPEMKINTLCVDMMFYLRLEVSRLYMTTGAIVLNPPRSTSHVVLYERVVNRL